MSAETKRRHGGHYCLILGVVFVDAPRHGRGRFACG